MDPLAINSQLRALSAPLQPILPKEIPDAIAKGFSTYGMQTFDQSLMSLVKDKLVTYDEALKHVSNPVHAFSFRRRLSPQRALWLAKTCARWWAAEPSTRIAIVVFMRPARLLMIVSRLYQWARAQGLVLPAVEGGTS